MATKSIATVKSYNAFESAQHLLSAIQQPINLDKAQVRVSASIGISFLPNDNHQTKDIIQAADKAMYMAKSYGKSTIWSADTPTHSLFP